MTNPRAAALAAEMNGVFGVGTIKMGDDPDFVVRYLPTGVLPIDVLLQGGVPRGRSIEIYGNLSTLKSYIGYRCIAMTQRAGGVCCLVDTEHVFDPVWATELGVNVDELLMPPTPTGERAVDQTEVAIRGGVDLVVWDSVAASLPMAEQRKQAVDPQQPARLASLMSAAMRKLTAANTQTALLFINQTRVNVGIMFGSSEAVPGGKALPFYTSMRLSMKQAGKVTRKVPGHDGEKMTTVDETYAIRIRSTLTKSKLNRPFRDVAFMFNLDEKKVDDIAYLISLGQEHGLVVNREKSPAWKIPALDISVSGKAKFHRAVMESMEIKSYLITNLLPTEFHGAYAVPKKRAVKRRGKDSNAVAIEPTLVAAPGKSSKTAATKKKSSSGNKLAAASRSTAKT